MNDGGLIFFFFVALFFAIAYSALVLYASRTSRADAEKLSQFSEMAFCFVVFFVTLLLFVLGEYFWFFHVGFVLSLAYLVHREFAGSRMRMFLIFCGFLVCGWIFDYTMAVFWLFEGCVMAFFFSRGVFVFRVFHFVQSQETLNWRKFCDSAEFLGASFSEKLEVFQETSFCQGMNKDVRNLIEKLVLSEQWQQANFIYLSGKNFGVLEVTVRLEADDTMAILWKGNGRYVVIHRGKVQSITFMMKDRALNVFFKSPNIFKATTCIALRYENTGLTSEELHERLGVFCYDSKGRKKKRTAKNDFNFHKI
jgi:hypothetical protein